MTGCCAVAVSASSNVDTELGATSSKEVEEVFTIIDGSSMDESYDFVISESYGEEIFTEGDVDVPIGRNASISKTITLAKGESKTFKFDVDGGLLDTDHNSVSVVINKTTGIKYQYIFENVTDDREIANLTRTGYFSGTASNLNPDDDYEITIINLGIDDLTVDVSITTYISWTRF